MASLAAFSSCLPPSQLLQYVTVNASPDVAEVTTRRRAVARARDEVVRRTARAKTLAAERHVVAIDDDARTKFDEEIYFRRSDFASSCRGASVGADRCGFVTDSGQTSRRFSQIFATRAGNNRTVRSEVTTHFPAPQRARRSSPTLHPPPLLARTLPARRVRLAHAPRASSVARSPNEETRRRRDVIIRDGDNDDNDDRVARDDAAVPDRVLARRVQDDARRLRHRLHRVRSSSSLALLFLDADAAAAAVARGVPRAHHLTLFVSPPRPFFRERTVAHRRSRLLPPPPPRAHRAQAAKASRPERRARVDVVVLARRAVVRRRGRARPRRPRARERERRVERPRRIRARERALGRARGGVARGSRL